MHADPHKSRPAAEVRRAHDMLVAYHRALPPEAAFVSETVGACQMALAWALGQDEPDFDTLLAEIRKALEDAGGRERDLAGEN